MDVLRRSRVSPLLRRPRSSCRPRRSGWIGLCAPAYAARRRCDGARLRLPRSRTASRGSSAPEGHQRPGHNAVACLVEHLERDHHVTDKQPRAAHVSGTNRRCRLRSWHPSLTHVGCRRCASGAPHHSRKLSRISTTRLSFERAEPADAWLLLARGARLSSTAARGPIPTRADFKGGYGGLSVARKVLVLVQLGS
jgi:hypothetical protein